ncbi:hypothetical protein H0H87_000221, partial [Tephrocybe sp. NHM501043]
MLAGILLLIISLVSYIPCSTAVRDDIAVGTALADEPFWLESIKHQGFPAHNSDPNYQVFRNVKDFGAKGDGITDDTVAIKYNYDCFSLWALDLLAPMTALPYHPETVVVVLTHLATRRLFPPPWCTFPKDANPYKPGGSQWFWNTNNFFRSVRNFIIDVRRVPSEKAQGTGIHWQVAQATSLINIVIEMSSLPGTAHQGIWMENGSGGFMGDLVLNGGQSLHVDKEYRVESPAIHQEKMFAILLMVRFTVRNVTINNADTAVLHHWNWGWTFQDITINNCNVGFDFLPGVKAVSVVDAVVRNTIIAVRSAAVRSAKATGSLVVNNLHLDNVKFAVVDGNNASLVPGGADITIKSWGQGNVYSGSSPRGTFWRGTFTGVSKPAALLDSVGRVFGKTHPQYAGHSVYQFVSAKDYGAKGDGQTDDTEALQSLLNKAAGRRIVFFDAGTYIVTSTLVIPAETRMVGEAWSVIAGKGKSFSDQEKPSPVVVVGEKGSHGIIEITDIIFTTVGPAPGATVVEWNIREPESEQGGAGMWDSHIVLGGAAGTELESSKCPAGSIDTKTCMAAFLGLHLTSDSSAYLEGTWVWLGDHDIDGDGDAKISIYSGRGILSESKGPVWMIGT